MQQGGDVQRAELGEVLFIVVDIDRCLSQEAFGRIVYFEGLSYHQYSGC